MSNFRIGKKSDRDALDMEPRRVQPFSNEIKHDQFGQPLSAIILEELLCEIGRKGFRIQVEPRE